MSMIAKWKMALLFAGEKDLLYIYIYILYLQREKLF